MTWFSARVTALIVIVVAVTVVLTSATAQGGARPTARISPSFQNVAVGNTFNVNVTIEGAPTFASYEFNLAFDPRIIRFVRVSGGGDILENAGRDPFCVGPNAGALENAVIRYGCASTGGGGGPSGSGTLVTLTFRAVCNGRSDIAFVAGGSDLSVPPVQLGSPLGNTIQTDGEDGSVNVNGAGCPTGNLTGDANCNGGVNAIDSAIVLQINAGIISPFSCRDNADVNDNGMIDAIDAALILQYVAGLISRL